MKSFALSADYLLLIIKVGLTQLVAFFKGPGTKVPLPLVNPFFLSQVLNFQKGISTDSIVSLIPDPQRPNN
jgi:hypothetical protein